MPDDDRDYLQRRAEAEMERATQASHPVAVAAHQTLANAYLDRLGGGEVQQQSIDAED